jgi:hypothetical protein
MKPSELQEGQQLTFSRGNQHIEISREYGQLYVWATTTDNDRSSWNSAIQIPIVGADEQAVDNFAAGLISGNQFDDGSSIGVVGP